MMIAVVFPWAIYRMIFSPLRIIGIKTKKAIPLLQEWNCIKPRQPSKIDVLLTKDGPAYGGVTFTRDVKKTIGYHCHKNFQLFRGLFSGIAGVVRSSDKKGRKKEITKKNSESLS